MSSMSFSTTEESVDLNKDIEYICEEKEIKWYYKDLTGKEYGPYPSSKMREWTKLNLIDGSLLVRSNYPTNGSTVTNSYETVHSLFQSPKNYFPDDTIKVKIKKNNDVEEITNLLCFSKSPP